MKVALVHDWLVEMGPEEQCLRCLCELFPDATLYTLFSNVTLPAIFSNREFRTTKLQNFPGIRSHYVYYLPLFPAIVEHLDLRGYDLVISNSRYVAKGVITQPETCHVCILHPAILQLWDYSGARLGGEAKRIRPFKYPFLANYYRVWDVVASQRVDYFIGASHGLSQHIRKYYRREPSACFDASIASTTLSAQLNLWIRQLTTDYQKRQGTGFSGSDQLV